MGKQRNSELSFIITHTFSLSLSDTDTHTCVCVGVGVSVCWKYWQFKIHNIDISIDISGRNDRCY
jgi:hypothetical protein